jgi:uncharacterized protein
VNAAEQLCLACGLCCDGALFDHVRLGSDEAPKKMKALGLPVTVSRSEPSIVRFPQPCSALCADRTCRLYADRPAQCRTFECGVYKAAQAGAITFPNALRTVKQARQLADRIRTLLRDLGDTDEHRSLSQRFRRMQRRVDSGGLGRTAGDTYGELALAMHRFHLLTHDKFYIKATGAAEPEAPPS